MVSKGAMKNILPTLTISALLVLSLAAQERERAPRGRTDQPKAENFDWDRFKERIEGAVERGDMTRDQANEKYAELKKKLTGKAQAERDQPLRAKPENPRQFPGQRRPDALGRVLGELIAQKKINREEARKIFEAAHASKSQMPAHQDRPNPQGRIMDELRDTLNQAREELADIREAREELARGHEEHEYHRREIAEREELRERENAERMERARHAEMMRKREEEEARAHMIENKKKELERYKLELMEQTKILEKQRRQLEEARREPEGRNREKKEASRDKE